MRYKAGTVPRSDLPSTQRWLGVELQRVTTAIDSVIALVFTLADRVVELFTLAGYGAIRQSGVSALPGE